MKIQLASVFLVVIFLGAAGLPVGAQSAKVDSLMMDYLNTHGEFCLGIHPLYTAATLTSKSGSFWPVGTLGVLNRNGFAYPKNSIGVSTLLGLDYRNFLNVPPASKVRTIANQVTRENPQISSQRLEMRVKERLDPGPFTYFQIGTEVLIIPKVGFGLFFPISENSFIDLGLQFPLLFNANFFVSF